MLQKFTKLIKITMCIKKIINVKNRVPPINHKIENIFIWCFNQTYKIPKIYMCVYLYMCIHTSIYIYIHTQIYIQMCVCVCVCLCVHKIVNEDFFSPLHRFGGLHVSSLQINEKLNKNY